MYNIVVVFCMIVMWVIEYVNFCRFFIYMILNFFIYCRFVVYNYSFSDVGEIVCYCGFCYYLCVVC